MNRRCRLLFVPMPAFRAISLGAARLVLPSGAEIVHAYQVFDEHGPGMGYLVTAPQFPAVPFGEQWPRVTAVIERTA